MKFSNLVTIIRRIFPAALMLVGLAMIAIAFGADLLFEGRPGFNWMQLLMALIGAGVVAAGFFLRRPTTRARLSRVFREKFAEKVAIGVVSTLVTLGMLEIGLAALGYAPDITNLPEMPEIASWWVCDEMGCRYITSELQAQCQDVPENRECLTNAQGFYDQEDFVDSPALQEADCRILVLGDSFTWGAVADVGKSWVEVLEAGLPQDGSVVVWNTGIPGTGTLQQMVTLQYFMPIMKPDLVVLGFMTNDFVNNLYPEDEFVRLSTHIAVRQYKLDGNMHPVRVSDEEMRYRAAGIEEPASPVEGVLRHTRLGSILVRGLRQVRSAWQTVTGKTSADEDRIINITEDLLQEMRDYVVAHDAEFLVLEIPHLYDVQASSDDYVKGKQIFTELAIPFIDPMPFLNEADYNPGDNHWNNIGHAKGGQMVLDCVRAIMDGEPVESCTKPALND